MRMLKVITGNLLTAFAEGKVNTIGHQCNCFSEMGAGIAKQIKLEFPGAYEADQTFTASPEDRLGKITYWAEGDKRIFNLYGQFHYGVGVRQTDYDALKNAMKLMLKETEEAEQKNSSYQAIIGFPYMIGCGLAGGEWDIVEKIIEDVFVNEGGRDVYLYKLQ